MNPTLSIAICTFNRHEMLRYCLEALQNQLTEETEILVIDNGTEPAIEICRQFPVVRYIKEENTGLAYARNRAVKEAQGEWILFLDDDAKADPKLVRTTLKCCMESKKVFGGVYEPWYYHGKPHWYRYEYGSNRMKYKRSTVLPKGKYLSGGIMALHKSVFNVTGDFITGLGMTGKQTGYGEETELQDRIRNAGIPIYYEPDLKMDHLVADYKLNVEWFLHSYFKRGKDIAKYSNGNMVVDILRELFIAIILLFAEALRYTPQLIFVKNYYLQNWKIDVLKKLYKRMGYIYQRIT